VVTYLHHHGSDNADEKMPWYRGEVSYGLELCLSYRKDLNTETPPVKLVGVELPAWGTYDPGP